MSTKFGNVYGTSVVSPTGTQWAPRTTVHEEETPLPLESTPVDQIPLFQCPDPIQNHTPRRATALLIAVALTAPLLPIPNVPFNPGATPSWLPAYPDFPARKLPRADAGLREDPLSKPPPQFGTAVKFTLDFNSGLNRTANLVGPTNYSVSGFAHSLNSGAGDGNFWILEDAGLTHWHNLEVVGNGEVLFAWDGGFVNILNAGEFQWGKWYAFSVSVGVGGNADVYFGVVGETPVHVAVTGITTGWAPSVFMVGTDDFGDNLGGRLASIKVHNVPLSASEQQAEMQKLAPARTANVQFWWELKNASTRLVDSSGFGRNLADNGIGGWSTLEGPFLKDGPFAPELGFPYEQSPEPVWSKKRSPALLDGGGGGDLVYTPVAVFDPATGFPYQQPPYPSAYLAAKRCTALLETGLTEVPRAGLEAVGFNSALDALFRNGLPVNNTSYSTGGWVKFDATTGDDSLIWVSDAAGTGLALEFKTGQVALVDTFGFSRPATIPGVLVDQKWYYIGLRVNGTTATIFRGSETDACVSATGTIVAQGASSKIWFSFTSNFLTGALSRWFLDDAQRTDAEFEAQRLSDVKAITASNTGYWKFFSEADKKVDSSGNGNTLSANSATGTWENIRGPVLDFVSKMAWQPSFPDFTRRKPTHVDRGGTSLVYTPVAAQVSLDWLPDYPDFPRRARPSALNEGGLFRTHLEYEPTTDWSPDFPDFAGRAALRPVNEGGESFANFDFIPKLAWSPSYPDFTRSKPRPVDTGTSVLVIQEREPVTDWLPDFPDFARAAPRPVNEGGVFRAHFERALTTEWTPDYPDFARRAAPRAVNEGGLAPFDNFDFVPKLAWAPSFPDFARKKQPLVNEGGEFFVKLEREPDVDWLPDFPDFARASPRPVNEGGVFRTHLEREPQLDWSPDFPDFVLAKARPVNEGGLSSFDNFDFVPKLSWEPSFPDFTRSKPVPVDKGGAFFVKVEREPDLDWTPDYPDFAGRALPRAVNEGGYDFQRFTPVTVAELWYPDYPDFARGPQRPAREGWNAFVKLEREPVTDWLPDFPDRVPGPRQPLNVGGYASLVNFDFVPKLGWSPDYPDFARAARRPANTGGLFPALQFNLTPPLTWSPDYPDFARGKPRLVPEGRSVFPIQEREPIVDWLPDYPDFARKARPPVNEGGLSWTQYEYEPTTDWSPEYPDFPGRALPRPVATGTFSFLDLDYTPALAWAPNFPDFNRAAPRPVDTGMLGYVRIFIRIPDVEWLPIMPDYIWPKTPLVNEGGTFFVKLEREPSTDWMPTFPDFVWAAERPVNEGGQFPSEVNQGNDTIFESGTATGRVLLHGQFTFVGQESPQVLRPEITFTQQILQPKKEEETKEITTDDVKGHDPVV